MSIAALTGRLTAVVTPGFSPLLLDSL